MDINMLKNINIIRNSQLNMVCFDDILYTSKSWCPFTPLPHFGQFVASTLMLAPHLSQTKYIPLPVSVIKWKHFGHNIFFQNLYGFTSF